MPKHNSTSKSRHKFIITCVIAVILIISASTIALFRTGDQLDSPQEQTETPSQPAPTAQAPSTEVPEADYLTLEDWGVRFTVPENVGEVKYYSHKSNVYPEFEEVDSTWYEFSTRRVEDLGGKGNDICVEPNDRNMPASRLGGVIRSSKVLPIETKPLNENPIEGFYYYYYGSSGSICSENNIDLQQGDLKVIQTMIETISTGS